MRHAPDCMPHLIHSYRILLMFIVDKHGHQPRGVWSSGHQHPWCMDVTSVLIPAWGSVLTVRLLGAAWPHGSYQRPMLPAERRRGITL